jgi:hypothetical protein
MPTSYPSALITDQGTKVHFRLNGHFYQLSYDELRRALGLPPGPTGLGITINGDRFSFEFMNDDKTIELTARQLQNRLRKRLVSA